MRIRRADRGRSAAARAVLARLRGGGARAGARRDRRRPGAPRDRRDRARRGGARRRRRRGRCAARLRARPPARLEARPAHRSLRRPGGAPARRRRGARPRDRGPLPLGRHRVPRPRGDGDNAAARTVYARWGFRENLLELVAPLDALAQRLGAGDESTSFGSIHVQTDDAGAVERAVRQFVPRLPGRSRGSIVAPPRNGWVAVYDDVCDRDPAHAAPARSRALRPDGRGRPRARHRARSRSRG